MQDSGKEIPYEIQLQGEGLNLKKTITEGMAARIMQIVMGSSQIPRNEKSESSEERLDDEVGRPPRAISEFIEEVGAKRNPDKILTIGQFLPDELGKRHLASTKSRISSDLRASRCLVILLGTFVGLCQ